MLTPVQFAKYKKEVKKRYIDRSNYWNHSINKFVLKHNSVKLHEKEAKVISDENQMQLALMVSADVLTFCPGEAIVTVTNKETAGIEAVLYDRFKVLIKTKDVNSGIILKQEEDWTYVSNQESVDLGDELQVDIYR